jgi:hypothetical protein
MALRKSLAQWFGGVRPEEHVRRICLTFEELEARQLLSVASFTAAAGYDLVTGRGSPIANVLVNNLQGVTAMVAMATTTTGTTSAANPNVSHSVALLVQFAPLNHVDLSRPTVILSRSGLIQGTYTSQSFVNQQVATIKNARIASTGWQSDKQVPFTADWDPRLSATELDAGRTTINENREQPSQIETEDLVSEAMRTLDAYWASEHAALDLPVCEANAARASGEGLALAAGIAGGALLLHADRSKRKAATQFIRISRHPMASWRRRTSFPSGGKVKSRARGQSRS